jgi:hypothetical protein
VACDAVDPGDRRYRNSGAQGLVIPPNNSEGTFHMMKKILLAISLLFAATLSNAASAQVIDEGPFASSEALAAHWLAKAGTSSQYGVVRLEGQVIYSLLGGFGPFRKVFYFYCSNGLIYKICPPNGPFGSAYELDYYWSTWASTRNASIYIYLNGRLIFSKNTGFGPPQVYNYTACANRGGGLMVNCSL